MKMKLFKRILDDLLWVFSYECWRAIVKKDLPPHLPILLLISGLGEIACMILGLNPRDEAAP
jgi:hypothetical protein